MEPTAALYPGIPAELPSDYKGLAATNLVMEEPEELSKEGLMAAAVENANFVPREAEVLQDAGMAGVWGLAPDRGEHERGPCSR